MKKQDLELQVREIIADKVCLDLEKVTIDSLLKNELGADSLDEIELVIDLEIAFDIEIPDDDVENLKTVLDYVNKVAEKLNIQEL